MRKEQILKNSIAEMVEITGCNCSLWDLDGTCIAGTVADGGCAEQIVRAYIDNFPEESLPPEIQKMANATADIFEITDSEKTEYLFLMEHGGKIDAHLAGELCKSQLEMILRFRSKKMDKDEFLQNLLCGSISQGKIPVQARNFGIAMTQKRGVIVIRGKNQEEMILELLRRIYTPLFGDYLILGEKGQIVLLKKIESREAEEAELELVETCRALADTISAEAMVNAQVFYGTVAETLMEIPTCYKEACLAQEVGRIFYPEKKILSYRQLGIGRLIYQLPVPLCEMFLDEVLQGQGMEAFDEETLLAVDKLFENNLNISETARQLYVHRNTLVYRLEKVQKKTGLDVRMFEDALTFKIACLVADYLHFQKGKENK